jgi:mitochondrial intermediate peptidase
VSVYEFTKNSTEERQTTGCVGLKMLRLVSQSSRSLFHGRMRRLPVKSVVVSSLSSSHAPSTKQPRSLYNLSVPLHEPDDFIKLTKQAIAHINVLRSTLRDSVLSESSVTNGSQRMPARNKLALMDAISNELCCIMDAAEMCRNSHCQEEFQHAAEEGFALFSEFIIELNSDHFLYERVVLPIVENAQEWAQLTAEEQYFLLDMKRDFESEGIHLKGSEKVAMKEWQQQVVQAETAWSQNLVNPSGINRKIRIGPFADPVPGQQDDFSRLTRWLSQYVPQSESDRKDRVLVSTLDKRLMAPLANAIGDVSIRKSLYFESFLQPYSNVHGLRDLLFARQSLARTLGMPSYTHRALQKHVNKSPEVVHEMLQALSIAVRPQAETELKQLLSIKIQNESPKLSMSSAATKTAKELFGKLFPTGHSSHNPDDDLHTADTTVPTLESLTPWDLSYYQVMANQEQTVSDAHFHAMKSLSSYFPLDACVNGLQLVSQQLFGVIMREVEVDPIHEDWTRCRIDGNDDHHKQSLRRFDVFDKQERFIGSCYFDLYHRDNKFPGAAHFTIRCGCQSVVWDDRNNKMIMNDSNSLIAFNNQTPIVALVFHFKPPSASSHSNQQGLLFTNNSQNMQPLLSLHDVETLFHEWGHALHSLLSTSKFQHLSGTRGGTDFIEVSN